ncbi:energy-coupling factor transporter ATPase [candidate division LCP-89 bacterium B3_LCP]|uniref:Energy-coupling factor transporter ATPase n=1 Tax=candidate division LCP-89 bacterium B3_LCP TaxID=2012998 RepID=A0A532V1Y7_UNCL8|nr:MAG: energy-coupling factor transporter ATPase [candidate division LCP-89 bacterium B3_LCP]
MISSTDLPPPCIHVENLKFSYPDTDKEALQGIDLQVPEGQCMAVLGSNGGGKSTLAKLIAGLLLPTAGRVSVFGNELSSSQNREAVAGRIGLVFQSPDEQMVATTVERELAFGPENLGLPSEEIRRRVDHLMNRFDLTEYANRSPHTLSGGEKQRLALASVLAMQPELLILDEVTSLLDPAGRQEIRNIIKELKRECTLILITQFPREALFADRLIVINDGRIVADDSPVLVFENLDKETASGIAPPLAFQLLNALNPANNPTENN